MYYYVITGENENIIEKAKENYEKWKQYFMIEDWQYKQCRFHCWGKFSPYLSEYKISLPKEEEMILALAYQSRDSTLNVKNLVEIEIDKEKERFGFTMYHNYEYGIPKDREVIVQYYHIEN